MSILFCKQRKIPRRSEYTINQQLIYAAQLTWSNGSAQPGPSTCSVAVNGLLYSLPIIFKQTTLNALLSAYMTEPTRKKRRLTPIDAVDPELTSGMHLLHVKAYREN